MQKVIFQFFVAVGHAQRALKRPATWVGLIVLGGCLAWYLRHREATKLVNQLPPIQFKPLVAVSPVSGAVGNQPVPSDAPEPGSPVDPEQLPVMASRDLEVAVGRFHKDKLRLPQNADELIELKYLVGVPPAPPGKRYQLDLAPIKLRLVSK